MNKVALVVFAESEGSHSDLARVVNTLEVAKEFKDGGDEVEIIFDGAGVTSAVALADPENKRHRLYGAVQDKVSGVCAFCAKAFGVYEKAQALNIPLLDEHNKHPSLRTRVNKGYQVITF
ncbi:MAG: hypothetical protein M1282_06765 [Chloroflexi bacterium]|nr:hypothetical protein [Chloroflexota bacterium]